MVEEITGSIKPVSKELSDSLRPLFKEAEENGMWFFTAYHGIWFSPESLRDELANGNFRWGSVNWTLRDPKERVKELRKKAEDATAEADEFEKKLEAPSMIKPVLQPTHEILLKAAELIDLLLEHDDSNIVEEQFRPHSLVEALRIRAIPLKELHAKLQNLRWYSEHQVRHGLAEQSVGLKSIPVTQRGGSLNYGGASNGLDRAMNELEKATDDWVPEPDPTARH